MRCYCWSRRRGLGGSNSSSSTGGSPQALVVQASRHPIFRHRAPAGPSSSQHTRAWPGRTAETPSAGDGQLSSSDTAVVTFDPNGVVTGGLANGTA